jgi:hypothetical protein
VSPRQLILTCLLIPITVSVCSTMLFSTDTSLRTSETVSCAKPEPNKIEKEGLGARCEETGWKVSGSIRAPSKAKVSLISIAGVGLYKSRIVVPKLASLAIEASGIVQVLHELTGG